MPAALSVGGNYDVTSVWLVLWQLCIARRSRCLPETWYLIETRRILEHGPQNTSIY